MSYERNNPPVPASPSTGDTSPVAPMTASLMGRLFVVPAILVCVLLGVTVVVVMFGATSLDHPATIDELLTRIDSDSGDRKMGVLFPSSKEPWLAAQELARRLQKKDEFLKPSEVDAVAERIVSILDKAQIDPKEEQGVNRASFLMMALARLETSKAVPALVKYLHHADVGIRRTALMALADMRKVPAAKTALPDIYPLLDDESATVRMVACLTVASLANSGDSAAVTALAAKLDGDAETQWNAATALARLGSLRGKLVLLNMLDRGFWEKMTLNYEEDGATVTRKLSPSEVADRLVAAIDAVSHVDDAVLKDSLRKLSSDPYHAVRDAAASALKRIDDEARPPTQARGMLMTRPALASTREVS